MTQTDPATRDTRERILGAAVRLFAERGYEHTTVRDITEEAGANVAAVHYHFGGKKALYLEVFRVHSAELSRMRTEAFHASSGNDPRENLETVLRAFVGYCFGTMLSRDPAGCFTRMILREVSNPGPAFTVLFDEVFEPNNRLFRQAIRRAVPGMSEERAVLCVASLFAQMVHFARTRPVLEKLLGRSYAQEGVMEALRDHIVQFTLEGVGR